MTDRILLAHGGGGRRMRDLIDTEFAAAFGGPLASPDRHDGAVLDPPAGRLAFTTDSYVVSPLFFPGGDIGKLAVCGTVNDLLMCGARPLWLSAGFVLEEGLPLADLRRIVASMAREAHAAGVRVVTGDTKVVERGRGDGVYLNTAGVGAVREGTEIGPTRVRPGDAVVLSGDVGRHGVAVLSVREGLAFETEVESDCASLVDPVLALLDSGVEVRCLRDLTRGGLASALAEIAAAAGLPIRIEERAIPVADAVRGACEILGFDPLYVANEGRFVAFVAPGDADRARAAIGEGAAVVGRVGYAGAARVVLETAIGGTRVVDLLSGDQLPRIC